MKTFLIPTTFDEDTNKAAKVAMNMFSSPEDRVVLFSVSDVSNSITDLLFLADAHPVDLTRRQHILDYWSDLKKDFQVNGNMTTHHQYGLSRPIFESILQRFDVSMSVVPESFQNSKQYIHQFMLKLLHQSNCPMMLLPQNLPGKGIQRALYLDEIPETRTAMVQGYPFHVIHKSMVSEAEYPSVKSIVEALHIDLIVKGKRVEGVTDSMDREVSAFGLPVLAV